MVFLIWGLLYRLKLYRRFFHRNAGSTRMFRTPAFAFVAVAVVALFSSSQSTGEQSQTSIEYSVKSAYLYNFAKFVTWPKEAFESPDSPLVVAVVGEDPFGKALDTIHGKPIRGRKIQVRRYRSFRDIEKPHILFVAPSEKEHMEEILERIKDRPVLTVGDFAGFIETGGMINLITIRNKIRFQINNEPARQKGLIISAHVLKLSRDLQQPSKEKVSETQEQKVPE